MTAFHDPSRPLVNNRRAYCNSRGRPIAPLPHLYVSPSEDNPEEIYIGTWLLTAPNNGKTCFTTIPKSQLAIFWDEWLADPEGVMRQMLGYDPDEYFASIKPPARGGASVSLDDLDL